MIQWWLFHHGLSFSFAQFFIPFQIGNSIKQQNNCTNSWTHWIFCIIHFTSCFALTFVCMYQAEQIWYWVRTIFILDQILEFESLSIILVSCNSYNSLLWIMLIEGIEFYWLCFEYLHFVKSHKKIVTFNKTLSHTKVENHSNPTIPISILVFQHICLIYSIHIHPYTQTYPSSYTMFSF